VPAADTTLFDARSGVDRKPGHRAAPNNVGPVLLVLALLVVLAAMALLGTSVLSQFRHANGCTTGAAQQFHGPGCG
jgi:hypothetical protein